MSGQKGFNPVELVDFILGWFKIDICSDDPNYKIVKTKRMFEGQWRLIEPKQLSSESFPLLAKGKYWRFVFSRSNKFSSYGTAQYTMGPRKSAAASGSFRFLLASDSSSSRDHLRLSSQTDELEEEFKWSVKGDTLTLTPWHASPGRTKKIRFKRISR